MRGLKPFLMLGFICASSASATVTFDWVTVGNSGNPGEGAFAGDTSNYGAVDYVYQISRHEVTNSQYAEFLNAKAASDPLALYNANMANDANGGITRSGPTGNYTYAVKPGYGSMPVVYVSWYDSIRFANWMHNGQGSGSTEFGAYGVGGGTPTPSNGNTISRSADARVFLTSENEWYKAAYYSPTDGYWTFATGSDNGPYSDQPPGSFRPTNSANYLGDDNVANGYNDGYAVTGSPTLDPNQNYLTPSAPTPAPSVPTAPSTSPAMSRNGTKPWSPACIADIAVDPGMAPLRRSSRTTANSNPRRSSPIDRVFVWPACRSRLGWQCSPSGQRACCAEGVEGSPSRTESASWRKSHK